VTFSAPGGHAAMAVTLTAGSVHTLVVLDGSSGLKIDNLTDAARSTDSPKGGAATGFGGMAPRAGPGLAPWLGTLAGGVLLAFAGGFGLRRSRRTAAAASVGAGAGAAAASAGSSAGPRGARACTSSCLGSRSCHLGKPCRPANLVRLAGKGASGVMRKSVNVTLYAIEGVV
jgi:hypothetical protein